jgi:hypothetical protein
LKWSVHHHDDHAAYRYHKRTCQKRWGVTELISAAVERSTAFVGSQYMSPRQEWDLAQSISSQSVLKVLSARLRVKCRCIVGGQTKSHILYNFRTNSIEGASDHVGENHPSSRHLRAVPFHPFSTSRQDNPKKCASESQDAQNWITFLHRGEVLQPTQSLSGIVFGF